MISGTQKTSPQESLVGQILRNGEYIIKRVIGHGGMGKVYLATHATLALSFAIKQARADEPLPESVRSELGRLLYEGGNGRQCRDMTERETDFPSSGGEHTDRFSREALFLARLQHVAIPSLYDYFFENGYWYLVMDFVPGPTLTAYLRQYAPLPPLEAINYAMQLCDVLDYLHKQEPPIIFRDLKPSNSILTPDGSVMLVDFGIARYFKDGQINDTTDFGSPGYASPEQYQGEGQTDARSDLFSLGVLLHEMLTGQHPGGLGGRLDTVQQLNPTVSAVLSGLVTLATRSDPMYRFQSAYTFYTALDRAYSVEEQRAYQHHVEKSGRIGSGSSTPIDAMPDRQDTPMVSSVDKAEQVSQSWIPSPQRGVMTIEQRQHTRVALQEARQERMEQEQLEYQLASVDESLKIRTSVPFSYEPQPFEEELVEEISVPPPVAPPSRKLRRIIQASFLVALLLFSVMASLLLYAHVVHHDNKLVKGQHIVVTQHGTSIQSTWNILPSLSSPEADNTVAYVQVQGRSYIYMSGGYRGAKNSPHYDRHLYRYDILAAHWEQVPSEHFPGMVNNAVAQDEQGQLFFTVGYSTDVYTVTSLLYQYQPATGTVHKITPPPQVSIGFGAALLADQQGHLYITQGFQKSGDPHAQAGTGWYRYDISTDQWHILAPLPRGLGYVVLANDGSGNIILLGGATDAGQHLQTDAMYRYNSAQNAWTDTQTKAPSALSGVASCSPKPGQIVLSGGYDSAHGTGLAQTWLIDLHSLAWTALTSIPTGGSVLGAAACDGQGHIFLVRGASDPNTPTQDFWQMTIQQ